MDLQDNKNLTALMFGKYFKSIVYTSQNLFLFNKATANSGSKIVSALISANASLNIKNNNGASAIYFGN